MNKKMLTYAFVLSSAAFLQTAAAAAAVEAPPEYSLDEMVVTANRIPTPLAKAAANTTVITAAEIAAGHYQNLGDVLSRVNGVSISGGAYAGQGQGLRINGDDRVLLLCDGIPVSRKEGTMVSGKNPHSAIDVSTLVNLESIERIEIVKGGASALYGADAVGGVVNIISKKGESSATLLRSGFSSWGGSEYVLATQGTAKDWHWFVSFEQRRQDHSEYNPPSGGAAKTWPNSGFSANSATLRLDKDLDKARSLTLNVSHSATDGGQPGLLSYSNNDQQQTLWNNWSLTYNFDRDKAAPGHIRYYENYYSQFWQGVYQSRTRGVQLQKGWQTDKKNTLVAGIDWQQGTLLKSTYESGGFTTLNYANKSVTDLAAYLQSVWKLDNKWTVTPGLRYDNYSRFGGQATPKLQVNYAADAKTDLYASYNKVFRIPTLDDLYYTSSWAVGNPNLQPETGRVITLGVNHRFNKATSAQLSYFDSQINNAIYWVGYPLYLASNVDENKQGFEFSLKHAFSPKYYAQVGYSYLKAHGMSQTGSDLARFNAQPNGYRIGVGYQDAVWTVGLDGSSASGRNQLAFAGSSYWRWDLHADYKINKQLSAYGKINNLTNEAYQIISTSSYGDSPMPARNIQFGLQYTF